MSPRLADNRINICNNDKRFKKVGLLIREKWEMVTLHFLRDLIDADQIERFIA